MGKEENDRYQHFLHFLHCFLKAFYLRAIQNWGSAVKGLVLK